MISNKTIAFATVGFAAANALTIQSKLQSQIEAQNDLLGFEKWIEKAGNDAADWTAGAAADVADWVYSATNEYTLGDAIKDGKKALDATEDALNDAANWTAGAFTDAYDWMKDGDNWEALGKTVVGSTVIGFSGDWEKGWELFTNSDMYYGDTYDKIEKRQKQKKAYDKAMKKQAEQCSKFEPKVGQPIKKGGR